MIPEKFNKVVTLYSDFESSINFSDYASQVCRKDCVLRGA